METGATPGPTEPMGTSFYITLYGWGDPTLFKHKSHMFFLMDESGASLKLMKIMENRAIPGPTEPRGTSFYIILYGWGNPALFKHKSHGFFNG